MKKYFPYINNQEYKTSKTCSIPDTTSNEILGEIYALSAKDIEQVFDNSQKAFKQWRKTSSKARIDILKKWIVNLQERKESIAEVMCREISKNYNSCISEIERAISAIESSIHAYYSFFPEAYDGANEDKDFIAYYRRKPLGIILCISPFNYPVNLSIVKIAPAIITGNCVVFKSSTQGSLTCSLISKALIDAGIPSNVFQYVSGKGSEIGDILVANKHIKMINFTGSSAVGMNIPKKAFFAKFILELGGNGTAIVLKDANLDLAAKNIIAGGFSYNGQRCTAIKRVVVEKSVSKKLTLKLVNLIKNLTIGMPYDNKFITPMINKKAFDFVVELLDDALMEGAKAEIGNKTKEDINIIYPTLLTNVKNDDRIFNEEQFGPVLPIFTIDDNKHDKIVEIVNRSNYGLQSCVFTKDIAHAMFFANEIETGSMHINAYQQRGPEYLPFLGIKESGYNKQSSLDLMKAYTYLHGIVINDTKSK